jgi:hypothetical protein
MNNLVLSVEQCVVYRLRIRQKNYLAFDSPQQFGLVYIFVIFKSLLFESMG